MAIKKNFFFCRLREVLKHKICKKNTKMTTRTAFYEKVRTDLGSFQQKTNDKGKFPLKTQITVGSRGVDHFKEYIKTQPRLCWSRSSNDNDGWYFVKINPSYQENNNKINSNVIYKTPNVCGCTKCKLCVIFILITWLIGGGLFVTYIV